MVTNQRRLLSVIVPAYKQEKTIKVDLESVINVLKEGLPQNVDYEVICVVDGKVDNTEKEARKVDSPKLKVVSYPINRGKGYAVRYGMSQAGGDLISFLDAGRDISPKGMMMLLAHMEWYNADIIVGSKRHPASKIDYPFWRKVLSIGYHFGAKVLFGLRLTDTQSGIKIFKRQVVDKILPRLLVKRYAMDIEMLAVARYLGFTRIYEAPIEITFNRSTSRINWYTAFKMAQDTAAVFYRLHILHFYDDKNRANWVQ